ncbi:MAG: nucleotidyltransferase family protein [Clostridia bacterium]|nr:nucleotidyltransferase family protein [Clostridia bacterium]
MEICAIICEFNPFHNGHAYLLRRARELSGCGAVLCVMSGSFTQRGEICRTDKFLRAKHAVLCGADAVVELPAPFAVAPAKIFARGAVGVISSIPQVKCVAFGCESGDGGSCEDGEKFKSAARILSDESALFKATLEKHLNSGESYIKSYGAAFEACGGNGELLSSPNNVLGVEYAKAVLNSGADIKILPVKRVGAGFNDEQLADGYSSASGIRANADNPKIKNEMPECSYDDFIKSNDNGERFRRLAVDSLYLCDKENLKRVYGCTEGLENRLKSLAFGHGFEEIVELACSKRYSKARIRRILTANLLGLYADQTAEFLQGGLPVKVLAVKKERADELLPLLSVTPQNAESAQACAELSSKAYGLWRYLSTPLLLDNPNEKMILV